jgi:ATP-dependent RNA helicase SUPV3L1/SUV3
MEVFFTFTWGGRPAGARRQGGKPQGQQGKPRREGGKGGPKGKGGKGGNKPQSFEAKPRREKQIDPNNPFAAALSGFKAK